MPDVTKVPVTTSVAVRLIDGIDPTGDPESAHGTAEAILLLCAPREVREAYMRLVERAPWWATA